MNRTFFRCLVLLCVLPPGIFAQENGHGDHGTKSSCCQAAKAPQKATVSGVSGSLQLPDVTLTNQDGQAVNLFKDVMQDRLVVMNFIFTSCKTICPPMGAQFAALQKQLGSRVGNDIAMVSLSIDPQTDTPQRLKSWAAKFGAKKGWTLLTGAKPDVDEVLKALEVFTADKSDHAPFILAGNTKRGEWRRIYGLSAPRDVIKVLDSLQTPAEPTVPKSAKAAEGRKTGHAETYFSNLKLTDQNGQKQRLFRDLMDGKIVVMHSFFGTCEGSCPVMLKTFAGIQEQLGPRLGPEVHLLSISVDPRVDTPQQLAGLAKTIGAKPGWFFLSGDKVLVDQALHKFGHYVEQRESHSNVFIIGNVRTGLWKKTFGLGDPQKIWRVLESVMNDKPS